MQTMTFLSKSLNQQAGAIINASIIKDDIIKSHQQRRDIYRYIYLLLQKFQLSNMSVHG